MTRFGSSRNGQRGAVLYVALVLLILLALIGITGMQVSGLQERMSSAYRATNVAFQDAEGEARTEETGIVGALGPTGTGSFAADQERCDPAFDPAAWAEASGSYANCPTPSVADGEEDTLVCVRRIDQCSPGGSIAMAKRPLNEETNLTYQISAYGVDDEDAISAQAVIDTVYIP